MYHKHRIDWSVLDRVKPDAVIVIHESGDGDVYSTDGEQIMEDVDSSITLRNAVERFLDLIQIRADGGGVLVAYENKIYELEN